MDDLLAGLNPSQQEAVLHVLGPLLVLAGPGSGKTRVITHRIANLIKNEQVDPSEILAVTFTNKAAEELRHRLDALVPNQTPVAGTFHSFCARELRRHAYHVGLEPNFSIVSTDDRNKLLSELVKERGLSLSNFPVDGFDRAIGRWKSRMILPEQAKQEANDFFAEHAAQVYATLQDRLREANSADFDDLLMYFATLLQQKLEIRKAYDQRFRFVLVDEYQDTNLAQYAIARMLCIDHPNLCVTGDPDQSIYSWRGADIRNILSFEKDFPDAKVIRLERNYRSTGNIVSVAQRLIERNEERKDKSLVPVQGAGERVQVRRHKRDLDEAADIGDEIRLAIANRQREYRDIAILLRASHLMRTFEAAFRQRNIPYQIIGGFSFFERKEIRDIVAYARLAMNPRDTIALARVVNTPTRGIGPTTFQKLRDLAQLKETTPGELLLSDEPLLGIKGKALGGLDQIRDIMRELRGVGDLAPSVAMGMVCQVSGLLKQYSEDSLEDEASLQIVQNFLDEASQAELMEPLLTTEKFLETISLRSDADGRNASVNVVTIMTLHAAKGLEFPWVYMPAFENGVLPHRNANQERRLEEERRLAFVGITRAKEKLTISFCDQRGFGQSLNIAGPSSFLLELPKEHIEQSGHIVVSPGSYFRQNFNDDPYASNASQEYDDSQEGHWDEPVIPVQRRARKPMVLPDLQAGQSIRHPEFGIGVVLAIEGKGEDAKATVQFVNGKKSIFLKYADFST